MPLVTANQFQLVPDIVGGIARGQQLEAGRIQLEQARTQQSQEMRVQELLRNISGGALGGQPAQRDQFTQAGQQEDPRSRDQNIAELFSLRPELAKQTLDMAGLVTQQKRQDMADFAFDLKNTPFDQRGKKINARAQKLIGQGDDPTHTLSLLDMPQDVQDKSLSVAQIAALPNEERVKLAQGPSAQIKEVGGRLVSVTPTGVTEIPGQEAIIAREGVEVSEVQSSKILPGGVVQIVRKDGTTEVIESDKLGAEIITRAENRGVDIQQARAQGRGLGKDAAKKSQEAIDTVSKLRSNNESLRQVIASVGAGAETGPLARRLPSFRAESIRLDNLRNNLGLDVIGSVTFGALSEGELQLALDTALPTGLEGPELVRWAQEKIDSQDKLANYLEDQAIFLGKRGNTVGKWIEQQKKEREEAPETAQQTETPATQPVVRFNRQGQRVE